MENASSQYIYLPDYYDKLMYDIDYDAWAGYILDIIDRYGVKGSRMLEMACGTGNMSIRMAQKGFNITAFDLSNEMLSIAYNKVLQSGLNVNILRQDMTDIQINQNFDIMLCICDSINYITDPDGINRLLVWAYNHLDDGGIFIFDINTSYKLRNIIGNNVFTHNEEDIAYIWENFVTDQNTVEFYLTFFVKEGKLYRRYDETHIERIYEIEEIIECARGTSFTNIDAFEAFTFNVPEVETERVNFVLRK